MELMMLDYLIIAGIIVLVISALMYYYSGSKLTRKPRELGEYIKIKTPEQALNDIQGIYNYDYNEPKYRANLANLLKRNVEWNRENSEQIDMIKAALTDLYDKTEKKSKR